MDEAAVGDQQRIEGEAADWLAAIDCGTADRAAFERWRGSDSAHALAFIRALQVSKQLELLSERGLTEKQDWSVATEEAADNLRFSRRRMLQVGALGAVALSLAGIGWSVAAAAHDAQTAVGERQRIVVGKGISLDLNTNSHVRWTNRADDVEIRLLKGEVLLEREPGSAACSIFCDDVRIEPTTGRVNARLRKDVVEIAVFQGGAVVRSGSNGRATRIASLQRTMLANDSQPVVSRMTEIQAVTAEAWQHGEVQFNGENLDTAIAEYNRYLPRPLVITDRSIEQIRLGGRFSNSDPSDFLKALTVLYGVRVQDEPDHINLSRS